MAGGPRRAPGRSTWFAMNPAEEGAQVEQLTYT